MAFGDLPAGGPAQYTGNPVDQSYRFDFATRQTLGGVITAPVQNAATAGATTGGFLSQSTQYFYRVTALSTASGGETNASNEISFTVAATGTNTNIINVNWAASAGANAYRIYRWTSANNEAFVAQVGNVTTFADNTPALINSPVVYPTLNTSGGSMTVQFPPTLSVQKISHFMISDMTGAVGGTIPTGIACVFRIDNNPPSGNALADNSVARIVKPSERLEVRRYCSQVVIFNTNTTPVTIEVDIGG